MLKALRAEMNAQLDATAVCRKPALRRSDAPGALLATDLPCVAEDAAVVDFISRAERAAWRVIKADNGWLLLDKDVPVPAAALPEVLTGPCGRCLSVLLRHPDAGEPGECIRRLVTAQEAGEWALMRFCTHLHAELAAMLRRHEPLPGALIPYLAQAMNALNDGRICR